MADDSNDVGFSTFRREKLPRNFAYPLSQSALGEYLAEVPQRKDVAVSYRWFKGGSTLLTASYSPGIDFPEMFREWELSVYAVEVAKVPVIRKLLDTEALPQLKDWFADMQKYVGRKGTHYFRLELAGDKLSCRRHDGY
ncbi:MAG: hypothetical protein JSS83_23300 [Cyanobacteria bacterium SZAS LIN-3]|nr:hypothetical protein [Cyanobacteria bacterium SZAS LIN-3]